MPGGCRRRDSIGGAPAFMITAGPAMKCESSDLRRGPVHGEGYRTLEDMPAVTRAHDRGQDRESEPGGSQSLLVTTQDVGVGVIFPKSRTPALEWCTKRP